MKILELGIGICDCSPTYHGKLEGAIIKLGRSRFRLKEIPIDDGNSLEETYRNRCHFTLDMHLVEERAGKKCTTFIIRNDEIGPASKGRRLISGDIRQCILQRPVRIETIIRWATDLIAEMSEKQRAKWLAL